MRFEDLLEAELITVEENSVIQMRRRGGSQRTTSFMDEFFEVSDEHPFNRKARIFEGTIIELYPLFNEIHISDIVSTQPRSGAGARAIKNLMKLANKHRVKLNLTAKAYSNDGKFITDTEQLVKWYMRLGFNITDNLVDDPNDLEGLEEVEMTYFPR